MNDQDILKKKLPKTVIRGIMVAICLGITPDRIAKTGDLSPFLYFVRECMQSFSTEKEQMLLLSLGCMALHLVYKRLRCTGFAIPLLPLKLLAAFYALCQLVAQAYRLGDGLSFWWSRPVMVFRGSLLGISYSLVAYELLVVLTYLLQTGSYKGTGQVTNPAGEAEPPIAPGIEQEKLSRNMACMLLAWLPYYVIFFPGTANEDSIIQIMEFFHIKSYINDMTSLQGADIFITNHHPYLLTLLFGGFVKLGVILGSATMGFAVYIILHMIFQAAVFSTVLVYLDHIGVSQGRRRLVRRLYQYLPIFPMYSICMVKDTIYSAFGLLLTLLLWELIRQNAGKNLKSPSVKSRDNIWEKNWIPAMFTVSLLFMMTKVYGKYVMVLLTGICLLRYPRLWKKLLLSMALPVVLFQFVYLGALLPALRVAPGGVQEALSVPFQQTARYFRDHGQEITEEEYAAVDAILPADQIGELYDPELSNPVKECYNQQATGAQLWTYARAWLSMGLRHPLCYIEATANNIYGYFDSTASSYLSYTKVNTYLQDHTDAYPAETYSWLYISSPQGLLGARYVVSQMLLFLQRVPMLNVFLSIGWLPYLVLYDWYYLGISRRKPFRLLLVLPLLTLAICMLSPENGNCRYVMPIFYMLPLGTLL
jgi:hypothetical protein